MGKEETIQAEFTSEDKYKKLDYSIYSEKIDNNTAYIRLGICEVNPDLEKVVEDIGNYLNEGIINFIIMFQIILGKFNGLFNDLETLK